MTKTVKIGFDESSKAVTAHVTIEVTNDNIDTEALRLEAQELFSKAQVWATQRSITKLG